MPDDFDEARIPEAEREPIPGPDVDPVEQLAHVLPALWRTLKRAVRSGEDLPANESQVTILRLVIHHDGMTPAQLADVMHLARPTVSNLLKDLVRDGLVERVTSAKDARVVTILPTDAGRRVLQTFRQDRTRKLHDALARLGAGDRQDIAEAVAPLRRLLRELEAELLEAELHEAAAVDAADDRTAS